MNGTSCACIAKFVYLRYTVLKKVIYGVPVRYTSWAPYATNYINPPVIFSSLYYDWRYLRTIKLIIGNNEKAKIFVL